MHATTMIFLAVMPLSAAFFNYIMPLQIGARDVAFPRLNGFAFWVFLAGAVLLNVGWFVKSGAPDVGWIINSAHSNGIKVLLGVIGNRSRFGDRGYYPTYAAGVAAMVK
jgi:heme/copper-type cytochrome/quinol oxidase subunit 1